MRGLRHKPEEAHKNFQARDDQPIHVKEQDVPLPWELDRPDDLRHARSKISPIMAAGVVISGILAVVIIILLVRRDMVQSADKQENSRVQQEVRRGQAALDAQKRELDRIKANAATLIARHALSSPDWRGVIPFVRHPHRVTPLMEDYYARFNWEPMQIEKTSTGQFHKLLGHEFLAFEATDTLSGKDVLIGLENTPAGWKLDWEVFVPLARIQWNDFHEARPVTPRKIRVAAIRRTPTREILELSGIPEERALGVMLWCTDITDRALYAVLHEDSAEAQELDGYLSFEGARKFILELAFPPPSPGRQKDFVKVRGVVTRGWSYMEDHREELSGSPQSAPAMATGITLEK